MSREKKPAICGFAVLPIYGASLVALWLTNPTVTAENGAMENLQAGGLALAGLTLIPSIIRNGDRIPRFSCWVLLLLFAGFFLREVDVDDLAIPRLLAAVGGGTGRNIVMGTAVSLTAVYFFANVRQCFPKLVRSIATGPGVLLIAGCALYASSWPFDKGILPVAGELNVFCEEVVERGATFIFLACAVCAFVFNLPTRTSVGTQRATVGESLGRSIV